MRIPTESGLEGKTAKEVMNLSVSEKNRLTKKQPDMSGLKIDEAILRSENLRVTLQDTLTKAIETNDFSELIKTTKLLKDGSGSVEKMVTMQLNNAFQPFRTLNTAVKVFNEIGINGVLSGIPTQIVSLNSGLAMTMFRALDNFYGSSNMQELKAAKKHLFYLFYNFDFALETWKRSWDMEHNFANVGNSKISEGAERFVISANNLPTNLEPELNKVGNFMGRKITGPLTENVIQPTLKTLNLQNQPSIRKIGNFLNQPVFPLIAKNTDRLGKFVRLPSRLMTSVDALIQTPNIIASVAYQSFEEGFYIRKLRGTELDNYIKGNVDGVIQFFLRGQEGALGSLKPLDGNQEEFIPNPVLQRILANAKDFGKEITFTQDIRTESILGQGATVLNNAARNDPLIRSYFKFTRTPFNIIQEVNRRLPIVNMPIVRTIPEGIPFVGGKKQNLNLINEFLLPEMKADLLSPNLQTRIQAKGQIRMGATFGLMLAIATYKPHLESALDWSETSKDDGEEAIREFFMTGGGPNIYTREGLASFIADYKNGWRPYSLAKVLRDDIGNIIFENGQPVYTYTSYEWLPDPLLSFVRIFVDFQQLSPFVDDKLHDEFSTNWSSFIGRHLFDKNYTRPVYDLLSFFGDFSNAGINQDNDEALGYRNKRWLDYVCKYAASSIVPYSSLWQDVARFPSDLRELFGMTEREAQSLAQLYLQTDGAEGNLDAIKPFLKPDTKIYSGDTIEDLPVDDINFNETNKVLLLLKSIMNNARLISPMNTGGVLPNQVEHITNDFITYPDRTSILGNRFGFNIGTNTKFSTSKNHLYWEAQSLIGKLVPPPPDVIRGSKIKDLLNDPEFTSKDFVPIKLNTTEYNVLKAEINTIELDVFANGNTYNAMEAMNLYLNGEAIVPSRESNKQGLDVLNYEANKQIIKEFGLDSEQGRQASNNIYYALTYINDKYIAAGIKQYVLDNHVNEDDLENSDLIDRIQTRNNLHNRYYETLIEKLKNLNITN